MARLLPRSRIWLALAGLALALAAGIAWWQVSRPPPTRYVTAAADRGDVVTSISASGSVNPVETVTVGSYVSGVIQSLACDYNTRVAKGQRCAKIDPKPYQVVVDQDEAALVTAQAQLAKDQAGLAYARLAHQRADLLWSQDSIAHDAADSARSANDQAEAQVRLDAAQVAQKASALKAARINLDYTDIISPVSGTVVSRNVTAGQTVAASFQTPTLFLIARDLTKMQVDVNVSESDIGAAASGQRATFTVDAYPRHAFQGQVVQVRQAPISVQNVITYDVVLAVDNSSLMLKPGMTATARIETARAANVLRVPGQALRFTPAGGAKPGHGKSRAVWVQRNGRLVRIPVVAGLEDGAYAEIRSGDLRTGDQVVTAEAGAASTGQPDARPALRF
ncbi:efflux RND transporter periplasmic adaptor subunit [Phenylobacterium montanum]|uniref:Efflux RND transporter periplasmic adaptor subunit n=1 Tax=Phenylobacterium montanum TaxID=2823693 RepID=A0A975IUT6_9CAUL|nr:efflux RND transporter periplasmic adaptor subunit [Caulobacter sp. S6]QUD87854.1 efflux RND transporter periplasmic adaptor subunit [Caulobacter sp. S6]